MLAWMKLKLKWDDAPFRPRSHSADDISPASLKPVSRKPSFTLNPPLAKLVRKAYKKNLARLRTRSHGTDDRGYQSDDSAVGSLSDYTRPGTPELPEPTLESSERSSPLSEYDAPRSSPYDVPPPPVSSRSSLEYDVPPAPVSFTGFSAQLEYDFPPPPKCIGSSPHLEYDFPPPPKCAVSSPHLEYDFPPPPKCTASSPRQNYDVPPPPKYAGSSPHILYDSPPPPKSTGSSPHLEYDFPPPPRRMGSNLRLDYEVPPACSELPPASSTRSNPRLQYDIPPNTVKVRSAPQLDYDIPPPPRVNPDLEYDIPILSKRAPFRGTSPVNKSAPRLNYETPPPPRTCISPMARSSPNLQSDPGRRSGSQRRRSPSPLRLSAPESTARLQRTPSPRWMEEPCPCMKDHRLSVCQQDYDVPRDIYDVPPSPRPFESIIEENPGDISPTDPQERISLKAIMSEINAISRALVDSNGQSNTKTLVGRMRMLAERMAVAAWKHRKPWAAELDRRLTELRKVGGHKAQQAVALAGFLDEHYGFLFRSKPPVAPKPTELSTAITALNTMLPCPPQDFVPAVKRVVLASYRRIFAARTDPTQLCQAVRALVETSQRAAELYPLVAPLSAVKERAADVQRASNRLDSAAKSSDCLRIPSSPLSPSYTQV